MAFIGLLLRPWQFDGKQWKLPGERPIAGDSAKPPIAIGRSEPLPVGQATADESPFGCRDMAGNGMEWTKDLNNGMVPQDEKTRDVNARVKLRGRGFQQSSPLKYSEMDQGSCPSNERRYDVGFRVVLEP